MATTEQKPSDRITEIWEYHGIQFVDGETQYMWEANGEKMVFGKLKAPIVGALYSVSVKRTNAGEFVDVLKTPRFAKQIPDENKRREVVAASRVNETTAESWRMAKKENAEAIDDMTIAQLRQRMRKYPTQHRRAMLALVLDRLLRGAIV